MQYRARIGEFLSNRHSLAYYLYSILSLRQPLRVCTSVECLERPTHLTVSGRAALEGSHDEDPKAESTFHRASSMIDIMPQTEEEMQAIRDAVITREGLLLSVFDVLRRVPRRVLMVLKLNDLTRYVINRTHFFHGHYGLSAKSMSHRSLDYALMTTHSNVYPSLVLILQFDVLHA